MKKILSLAICLSLFTSVNANAISLNNIAKQEKINVNVLTEGVQKDLVKKKKNGVYATMIDSSGKPVFLDCDVTISNISNIKNFRINTNDAQTYVMEVVAYADSKKIESDTTDRNDSDISCSAKIEMQWTDVKGLKNTMDRLSGGYTVTKGEIRDTMVRWGSSHTRIEDSEHTGESSSFIVYPDYTGSQLHAHYQLDYKGTSNYDIIVCVQPSIFD